MTSAQVLAAVARAVCAGPGADDPLVVVAQLVVGGLGCRRCLVFEVVDEQVRLAAWSGQAAGEPVPELEYDLGSGVVGRVAAEGRSVWLDADTPRNPTHRRLIGLADGVATARLCVPGRAPDGAIAVVLACYDAVGREFSAPQAELFAKIAGLLALRVRAVRAGAGAGEGDRRQDWEALVAATITAGEAERRRVAGELHDGVSQALAGLAFRLCAAALALEADDPADVGAQLRAARDLAELALGETRSAIAGLHSPVLDDLGLAAALVSMARAVGQVQVDVDAEELDLPDHVVVALFRIAQEAVQNVVKHAGASKAAIELHRHAAGVVLTVTDDGSGFDAPGPISSLPRQDRSAPSYGLAGMFERVQLLGGRLGVYSEPGQGTQVRVTVPVP